jgi:hypothetical protein
MYLPIPGLLILRRSKAIFMKFAARTYLFNRLAAEAAA